MSSLKNGSSSVSGRLSALRTILIRNRLLIGFRVHYRRNVRIFVVADVFKGQLERWLSSYMRMALRLIKRSVLSAFSVKWRHSWGCLSTHLTSCFVTSRDSLNRNTHRSLTKRSLIRGRKLSASFLSLSRPKTNLCEKCTQVAKLKTMVKIHNSILLSLSLERSKNSPYFFCSLLSNSTNLASPIW